MSVKHSLHSNAFNFMSFIQGGVDPRTGQYTMKIELPDLCANTLLGPEFTPTLSFSPLNIIDSGYGAGWTLQLSQYTPDNQVLALGTGETYRITDRNAQPMVLAEQKLVNFKVYRDSDDAFRIEHRSGLVEILTRQGSNQAPVFLPARLFSAQGQSLAFTYRLFNSQHPVLDSISDDTQQNDGKRRILFQTARTANAVVLKLHPFVGADGAPLVTYDMQLKEDDQRVERISVLGEAQGKQVEQARWDMMYVRTHGHLCLSRVTTPTGAVEMLSYADAGHQFPAGSGRPSPLPRVTRHQIEPGAGQPLVDVDYRYPGAHNFIGGGTSLPWRDDGLDNLYKLADSDTYEYQSVEVWKQEGQEIRSITRTFNRYHLLTEVKTLQGNCQQTSATGYTINAGGFHRQPPTFQLPTEETRRWVVVGSEVPARSESVISTYDNHGNVLTRKEANGIEVRNEWFQAAEQEGHPHDPSGFVRHLKSTTTYPASDGQGLAPVLSRRFSYVAYAPLDDAEQPGPRLTVPWFEVESETLVDVDDGERWLECARYEYEHQAASCMGRVREKTVQYPAGPEDPPEATLDTVTHYDYSTPLSTYTRQSVLHTLETLTGYDGEVKQTTLEHSLHTGQPLLNRDDNDVEIRYEYDPLQRVTQETVAPGKPHEATRRYTYFLRDSANGVPEQWQFDVKGVKTITYLDGLNRVVEEQRMDVDHPLLGETLRQTYRAGYDALGQMQTQTEIDWLGDQQLELTSTFEYDDWGEQDCVVGPDGVREYTRTDPVGTPASKGPVITQWREVLDEQGNLVSSGITVTWLNLFDKPTRIERFAPGKLEPADAISLQRNQYDGLGRLFEESVGMAGKPQRVNRYTYDAFERLVIHTLPDAAQVRRSFAAHSREDLPTRISVSSSRGGDQLLGEQGFDGLNRRISATTGGRLQRFEYEPGQRKPCWVTMPSGERVHYEYQPSLSEQPTVRTVGGVTTRFTHDPQNARLIDCEIPDLRLTRDHFSNGDVKVERRWVEGEAAPFEMRYDYSYRSRLLAYQDVLGQVQSNDYDALGQLKRTTLYAALTDQPLLQAHFSYDLFGRLHTTTTRDMASDQALRTQLRYDPHDREDLRTFEFGRFALDEDTGEWVFVAEHTQTLSQAYDDVDKLVLRVLSDETGVLREESYKYDLRGRLTDYNCAGEQCPIDPYGQQIKTQLFRLDAIDNIDLLTTTAADNSRSRIIYKFENAADPAQLTSIEHSSLPAVQLRYDANGNLIQDEAGRTLTYDALNRLQSVDGPTGAARYHYDPEDVLSGMSQ
ncbi:RHS repeat protein [Pseudomonas fulva]|uniref:RHS repeat protein n=1 Tax=Pseudomonas fulva TaxID=47880 RepID=A0A7S9LAE0_9PSED|nr:RHS repeat protein [Pseudomonas fulva]QPH45357.1 RHS repeat protein [Pseudomonas fulva]QPH50435.1 RHS repeat protein [Pseudomonas fulva]